MKLHYIADPLNAQLMGNYSQASYDPHVAPALRLGFVMGSLMQQISLYGSQIFRPLPLYMDQRPLAAAERKVLDAGQGKIVLLRKDGHIICVQDTPSGIAPVSTDTT